MGFGHFVKKALHKAGIKSKKVDRAIGYATNPWKATRNSHHLRDNLGTVINPFTNKTIVRVENAIARLSDSMSKTVNKSSVKGVSSAGSLNRSVVKPYQLQSRYTPANLDTSYRSLAQLSKGGF